MAIPVTLFLSAPDTAAMELLRDTRDRSLKKDDQLQLYVEDSMLSAAQSLLAKTEGAQCGKWELEEGKLTLDPPPAIETWNVLLYAAAQPPTDWLESTIAPMQRGDLEITRVITLVDCDKAIHRPEARRWYEVCIHFSDLVLLGKREAVTQKEIRQYCEHFEKERYPCLFDYVKGGIPKNVSWMLDSQPRRLSLIFDPPELSGSTLVIEEELEEAIEGIEELERAVDPYLEKNQIGERIRRIPNFPL